MGAIRKIEYTTQYDWATDTKDGTLATVWTQVTDFLADGLEPGIEEIITTEYGDNSDEQDGIKLSGEFKGTGANVPASGTRTWFRYTLHDATEKVYGGTRGCRVGVGHSGIRPLGGGAPYKQVRYTATGNTAGDLVRTPA